MGIWNKQHSPEPGETPDELHTLAQRRIDAAAELDTAIVAVEAAVEALLATDGAYFAHLREIGRPDSVGSSNLPRVLRTLIVGHMQVEAPTLTKHLGIPHLPARTRGRIADAVGRMAANQLNDHIPQEELS